MRIAFRTDSSRRIGTGHLMRCLTLADELARRGHEILFVCRDLNGNASALVRDKGYRMEQLPAPGASDAPTGNADLPAHSDWLGVDQGLDTEQTAAAIDRFGAPVDWLVVDHYALDARWEVRLRGRCGRLMVIDDLADRPHDSDLLLDQNLYEDMEHRYCSLISPACRTLFGPRYAVLRPEFTQERQNLRERNGEVNRVLVSFGGVDATNETLKALKALEAAAGGHICIDVVIGSTNRFRDQMEHYCNERPNTRLHVQTRRMAELMASADLSIGGAGTATWERCALGLPALIFALASNQVAIAEAVAATGAICYLGVYQEVTAAQISEEIRALLSTPAACERMSERAMVLADAQGGLRVADSLEETW